MFTVMTVGAVFGYLIGWVVYRGLKLDRTFAIFRIPNRWYYDFGVGIGATHIDLVTHVGDAAFLYSGFLNGFNVDKNGNLVDLILDQPERRLFSDHGKPFSKIDGHRVVIKYEEVSNINIAVWPLIAATQPRTGKKKKNR